ncbi:MAG TPA: hypothetical protein VJH03_03655 [Blastocatellia bacterium]|nr:hypothetical protein [Blastocatellia bacterium]
MLNTTPVGVTRAAGSLLISALLIVISFGQAAAAVGSDPASERPRRVGTEAASGPSEGAPSGQAGVPQRFATVQFALYRDVAASPAEPTVAPAHSTATPESESAGPGPRAPKPAPSVSTAPMTAGEKFKLFATKSFKPPGPYAMSAFSAVLNEVLDKDDGRESSAGDFFADSGTRMARSMAFRASANFFEKFAYPSIFKQDPRYHRSDKTGAGARIGYAVSRLFVTQGDRGGSQFNVSFIAGGMTAAAMSNVWERRERRTVAKSARRWGVHMGLTAVSNIFREFLSGQ